MSDIETVIYDQLRLDATVISLIGKDGAGAPNIYPDTLPAKTVLPAITYFRVAAARISTFASDTGLVWPAHFQVSIWAASKSDLLAMATAVRRVLKRLGSATYDGIVVDGVFMDSEGPDMYEPDALLYQRPLGFAFAYTEA